MPLLLSYTSSALALDPNRHISQYAHMAWRMQDGFFKSAVVAIGQTQDGYLWIGTYDGLLRFDGVRFVPWKAEHGERLPSEQIGDLLAASDGSLWIANRAGLSQWNKQKLTNHPTGSIGSLEHLLEDRNGKIWFAVSASLCEWLGDKTRCYGATAGVPPLEGRYPLIEDREGNLWLGGDAALLRWTPRSHTVYPLNERPPRAKGIYALASTPDGSIWVGIATTGPGLGLEELVQGRWRSFKTPEFNSSNLTVTALYTDHEGALWVGTFDHGVYRIYHNTVDHFDSASGLSGDAITRFSEDREGNLWVATSFGVDRFADTAVVSFSSKEGLCCPEASSILASHDGGIWTGGDGALTYLRNGMVSCLRTGKGLPGSQVTSMMEDHAGRLWFGVDNNLWVQQSGVLRRISRMDGSPVGFVTGIAEDTERNVWVTVRSPHRILMRIEGLIVQEEYAEPKMPRKLAPDPTGGIWIGLLNGDLAHYRNGQAATYRFAHDDSALVNQLLPNSDGSVLAATSYGLIGWKQGKPLMLTERNGLPCDDVYAMNFDTEGNLWLYMECGLGKIMSADLQMLLSNPGRSVSIRTLDALDGVHTGPSAFFGAAASTDGRLWFANGNFLQMIDPAHLRRNLVPPPVHLEQVIADRKSYPATDLVRLPARTRDLEIDYVGLSFVAPQKVLFRYRLEGHDKTWQEPGTRRQAFYSDLRPGTYHFRVIACNNDGLWNEEGAVLDFVVAAAFYQTVWFQMACGIAFLALLWGLYRYRLHQLAHQFNVHLEERVMERTRIARDLHDTLLQSFQGLLLEFQAARNLFARRPDEAMHSLDDAIVGAEAAIAEGRDAIQDLRSGSEARSDLAHLLTTAGQELSEAQASNGDGAALKELAQNGHAGSATAEGVPGLAGGKARALCAFNVTVEGPPQALSLVLQDEIYRIGREILRNAFRHARAGRIEVEIRYDDRMLRLRIRDDGIGIDRKMLAEGARAGHWGLPGVRERAKLIGAQLDFWSEPGAGTEVQVTVPASVAYQKSRAGRGFKWLRK